MLVVMASGKCELHTYFTFLQRILTSTHMKKFNIFLQSMSRCPTFTFQVSIMSKWLSKHISTKVSFKVTIRKRRVYIDIRWPWKWNRYFYLGFWEDERSKIIFSPSFQLITRLNLYMNIRISNWHNSSFDFTKINFFTLFQFLTRLLTSNHFNLIIHNSSGQMEWCENVLFSFSKCEKWKSAET